MTTAAQLSPVTTGPLDPALVARLAGLVTAAPGRPTQTSYAPFDGAVIGEVPTCTAEDVREAQRRARAAQAAWAARPLADRCAVMRRFHDLVLERQEQVLDVAQAETGKARISAFEELADVAMTARYYANTAGRHLRPRRRQGALPVLTRTVEPTTPRA